MSKTELPGSVPKADPSLFGENSYFYPEFSQTGWIFWYQNFILCLKDEENTVAPERSIISSLTITCSKSMSMNCECVCEMRHTHGGATPALLGEDDKSLKYGKPNQFYLPFFFRFLTNPKVFRLDGS
uniref:Microtubule-associated proteins 1A/1B light chain 3B n=1 Tax=Haliotis discus hannai TaxID=42344 RepID=A0A9E8MGT7_HALDH|nr:microtubule-associated proteins 1A/1B light chain 3B [Haliotis discus hannai]